VQCGPSLRLPGPAAQRAVARCVLHPSRSACCLLRAAAPPAAPAPQAVRSPAAARCTLPPAHVQQLPRGTATLAPAASLPGWTWAVGHQQRRPAHHQPPPRPAAQASLPRTARQKPSEIAPRQPPAATNMPRRRPRCRRWNWRRSRRRTAHRPSRLHLRLPAWPVPQAPAAPAQPRPAAAAATARQARNLLRRPATAVRKPAAGSGPTRHRSARTRTGPAQGSARHPLRPSTRQRLLVRRSLALAQKASHVAAARAAAVAATTAHAASCTPAK
jgi:hypothetical protein